MKTSNARIFAVRETLFEDKATRQKLKKFLERGGKIPNLTVAIGFRENSLELLAPFLPDGFTYDLRKSNNFSGRKMDLSVSLLLQKEGLKSIFFYSEELLMNHLNALNSEE